MAIFSDSGKGYALSGDAFAGTPPPPQFIKARDLVAGVIPAVCHIGMLGADGSPVSPKYTATGIYVGNGRILTNEHVLGHFDVTEQDGYPTFPETCQPVIDFGSYLGTSPQAGLRCSRVATKSDDADLAIICLLDTSEEPATPDLPVSDFQSGAAFTVGHPDIIVEGASQSGLDEYEDAFPNGDTPAGIGIKRLTIGTILNLDAARGIYNHRISTTGGSSGSPIFDLETGNWIGLHSRARATVNNAVPGKAILSFLESVAAQAIG